MAAGGVVPVFGWAGFLEPGFPFYASELDARRSGVLSTPNNVTPRGLLFPLGSGVEACFDPDLLRISAVWSGGEITHVGMARASYDHWDAKADVGEAPGVLPEPVGRVFAANGLYPGWQIGTEPSDRDPRTPAPSPEEPGRGPIDPALGRFEALQRAGAGVRLEYTVAGAPVREQLAGGEAAGRPLFARWIQVGACAQPLVLVLSRQAPESDGADHVAAAVRAGDGGEAVQLHDRGGWVYVTLAPHPKSAAFQVVMTRGSVPSDPAALPSPRADGAPARLWPQYTVTQGRQAPASAAYVIDDIPVPVHNPWDRNIRLADVQFLPDGTAAGVTFDGDVWLIRGLQGNLDHVVWRRFASGLHEPLSLAIRDGEIYVFDWAGIWRLRDTTGSGEADRYELFSNVVPQSADTREYATTIKLAPDGSFVLTKGGLAATYTPKLNGTVVKVSPDGRSYTRLGWGFRGPSGGMNPKTGLVTASDQEGRYVPASPLYIVEGDRYHGFLSPFLPKEKYPAPIADPWTWIPHTVLPSALTQVWLTDSRMGPMAGSMVLIAYDFPELFRVMPDPDHPLRQAAVASWIKDFTFPPLSGGMDPADGQLYVTGFQIFGTAAERISGLARVRCTGKPDAMPMAVAPKREGILLRFDEPLDPRTAAMPGNYVVERWNYKRAWTYGSLQYRLDGTVGQDAMPVTSVYLSADGRSVFLGVPGMKTGVMQMHVGWKVETAAGGPEHNDAYFTPYVLDPFDGAAAGFGPIQVDLAVRPPSAVAAGEGGDEIARGEELYRALGCMACHSTDGSKRVGPSWKGLYGTTVTFKDGAVEPVNAAYIQAHLRPHPDRVVPGFENAMPNYQGLVNDAQCAALVAYLRSLR